MMTSWWLIHISQAAYKNQLFRFPALKIPKKKTPPTSACMSIRSWGCLRKGTLEVSWYAFKYRHGGTRWWGHGCGTNHSFSVASHIVVGRCGVEFYEMMPVFTSGGILYTKFDGTSSMNLMKWMPLNTLADKFRHSQGHRRWNWVHHRKKNNAKIASCHFHRFSTPLEINVSNQTNKNSQSMNIGHLTAMTGRTWHIVTCMLCISNSSSTHNRTISGPQPRNLPYVSGRLAPCHQRRQHRRLRTCEFDDGIYGLDGSPKCG